MSCLEDKKYIASCSFGKDSLAMILKCIETNLYPIDEVVFYDTGMEFKAIYDMRDKLLPILQKLDIKYTEFKPARPFLYDMLEKPVKHKDGTITNGYLWCGGACRWGTARKISKMNSYCKNNIQLVGIAYDEQDRIKDLPNKRYPLNELKMTEKECLEYCYSKGFFWEEEDTKLYDVLDRVSCWCCRNKNKKELRNYYNYLPKYWNKLKELQEKIDMPFKNKTIHELEREFNASGEKF